MLFQVTAIILLLVFYGCYFGKMFLQKRQGIQTDQIGKGKTGTAKVIETLMKITTILVPLVEVICIVFNQTMLPFGARIKGAFIAAVGDIVFVTSVVTMKNSCVLVSPKRTRQNLLPMAFIKSAVILLSWDLIWFT